MLTERVPCKRRWYIRASECHCPRKPDGPRCSPHSVAKVVIADADLGNANLAGTVVLL